jgi:hypothetical protein
VAQAVAVAASHECRVYCDIVLRLAWAWALRLAWASCWAGPERPYGLSGRSRLGAGAGAGPERPEG